jgi:hypothetical protein
MVDFDGCWRCDVSEKYRGSPGLFGNDGVHFEPSDLARISTFRLAWDFLASHFVVAHLLDDVLPFL